MHVSVRLLLAAFIASTPLLGHASPITYTYTFNLTPTGQNPYGGTGTFTLTTPIPTVASPNGNFSAALTNLTALSFTIDNVNVGGTVENLTFNLAGDPSAVLTTQSGAIRNIQFAETLSGYTFDTTGGYTFVANRTNELGTFTNLTLYVPPPPPPPPAVAPEPGSLALLGTGMLGGLGLLRKRFRQS